MAAIAVREERGRSAGRSLAIPAIRVAIVAAALLLWEIAARSGLFFEGVFPPLHLIALAAYSLLTSVEFYYNLWVTGYEVFWGLVIGGGIGLATGVMLGSSNFLGRAYEPLVYYVSPTPKIILFPLAITWFGVDAGSKIGLGAIAAFFPVALNVAAGVRNINPIWKRVGRSFGVRWDQMLTKIYLPAINGSIVNAFRLGLAVAIISILLAETKLSREGLGFLVSGAFRSYDMPTMYALLVVIFCIALAINNAFARASGGQKDVL